MGVAVTNPSILPGHIDVPLQLLLYHHMPPDNQHHQHTVDYHHVPTFTSPSGTRVPSSDNLHEDGPCPFVFCAKIHAPVMIFATRSYYEWILRAQQGLDHFIAEMLFFGIPSSKTGSCRIVSINIHPLEPCADNPVVCSKEDNAWDGLSYWVAIR
jgi:hypothetical protein